jgi:hypothetical protein
MSKVGLVSNDIGLFKLFQINQNGVSDYVVLEGEQLQIPVELTMPLSCSWPKNM